MLIPTGFWSYTTADDASSRGKLSQLRALLAAELQQQVGGRAKVNIFQDVAAIPPGAEWERQIRESVEKASFIIPIVTPGFLQSEGCCREMSLFREREAKLSVQGGVFPIHYVDTDHLNQTEVHDPAVLEFLRTRQELDFRHLRFQNPSSAEVLFALEKLAKAILIALQRGGMTPREELGVGKYSPRDDFENSGERKSREAAEHPNAEPKGQEDRSLVPMAKLFVSHVAEDREAAMSLVEELERRNFPCWIAPRDVRPGRPFDDEIADAIDTSSAMLLIFSDRCNESVYIRREVTFAGESQKIIIPFRIENAQPRRGLRIRLSDLHWIDAFASWEQAIGQIAMVLAAARGST